MKHNFPPSAADKWLGKRIEQARIKAALTQLQLGRKVNVFVQQIDKYEKGARIPIALLQEILEAVNYDIPKKLLRKISNSRKLEIETKTIRDDLLEFYKEIFIQEEE
jgi:transcriptional regulator with XRE-family HTH domain